MHARTVKHSAKTDVLLVALLLCAPHNNVLQQINKKQDLGLEITTYDCRLESLWAGSIVRKGRLALKKFTSMHCDAAALCLSCLSQLCMALPAGVVDMHF